MTIGNYFCFDMPNLLSTQIKEFVTHEVNSENTIKYNQLYSFVSYPNIVLPLIGGIMASKFGLYKIMVSFSLFIIVGQLIFTAAGFFGTSDQNDNMPFIIAIVGRTIYGLGGEVLGVCQYTMISKWFKEKELSLSLSITLSVTWTGGIICSLIVPPLAEATSLSVGLACGLCVCVFSFIICISLIILDKYADKVDSKHDDFEDDEDEKFHWRDIKQFDRSYWLVHLNCFISYSGMLFYNVSNDFFMTRYGFGQVESARIGSNINFISIIFIPIFGYLSDKIGHRVTFCIISNMILTSSYILFFMIPSSASPDISYLGMTVYVTMGIGSTIYCVVIFPMIPLTVKPKILASAYGLNSALMNIGYAIGPIMVGSLTFQSKGEDTYLWVIVTLGFVSFLGFVISLPLLLFNRLYLNGILQKSSSQIEKDSQVEKESRA